MKIATSAAAALFVLGGCQDREGTAAAVPLGGTSQSPLAPDAQQAIAPAQPLTATEAQPLPVDEPASPGMKVKVPTNAWIGRWTGVEGLVLVIANRDGPFSGRYDVTVTLMDGTRHYLGLAKAETIEFERNGKTEVIRAATGAQTGLKWLAEKRDCLMIQPGEGFCRG